MGTNRRHSKKWLKNLVDLNKHDFFSIDDHQNDKYVIEFT